MFFTNGNWKIFIAGFLAFIILNTIENVIHYNIGRTSDKDTDTCVLFENPTRKDWHRILVVMIIFAFLQGILTVFIQTLEH
jgi:uncharacterized integral membrane protein